MIKFTLRVLILFIIVFRVPVYSQEIKWAADGNSFYTVEQDGIIRYTLPANDRSVFISKQQLTPAGVNEPLAVELFNISPDQKKILIYTNSQRVWRINTRGDYWILDIASGKLKKLGQSR